MDDIYGKVVGILIGAAAIFLIPFLYTKERMENLIQTALMVETEYFVDSVCHTGALTEQMLAVYERKLQVLGAYRLEIVRTSQRIGIDKATGEITEESGYIYEDELITSLRQQGKYLFSAGDFFRVQVKQGQNVILYYGGTITYENDTF